MTHLRISTLVALGLLALGAGLGCDRHVEAFDPNEKSERPDLARLFRPEVDPVADLAAASRGAPAPPPRGAPAPPRPDATADAPPISGTVRLAPDLGDGLPQNGVLFLMARREGMAPPLAVVRVASPSFPLDFEIGPANRMIESIPFEGPLQISARLDADGDASTRAPGDLQGGAPEAASPGATGVVVTLDERL